MKCTICKDMIEGHGHNGDPLVNGQVCNGCNWKVIRERISKITKLKVANK